MTINFKKYHYTIEKGANVLGALIYTVFASTFAKDIIHIHRLSSFFPLMLTSLFMYFFLTRNIPKRLNLSPYDWLITLNGTFLPLCLRPAPFWHDSTILLILQSIGMCISIMGIMSLNKSIGLVATNRGVKTLWAYKYVRHPIYAGYFITCGTFCAQNFTAGNVIITLLWMACEILRIFSEERYLSSDPVYASYMKKVRWRLIPYLF